jgi:acetylornithine deacetylase/succinyl-diaminopimelate desuccinylase family protein
LSRKPGLCQPGFLYLSAAGTNFPLTSFFRISQEVAMIADVLSNLDDAYTVRVLKEMIGIPSVVGEEQALALYLFDALKGLGFQAELHEVEPGRPNVYARLEGGAPGKRLNFCGHTDTVPVVDGWDSDPFSPVEKEGRLYGLGACDMKAGIACALTALRAFVKAGHSFPGELSFAGVIDEEAHSKGARAMVQTEYARVDGIVLAEPYPGDASKPIPLGITGKILYDILVKGKAAHGFRPHLGINAIEEASRIIAHLSQLEFVQDPQFGVGNTCTLKIEGGYTVYSVVIPSRCRFEVNRLLVPGETPELAVEQMQRLIASLHLDAEVEVRIKPPQYAPFVMRRDEAILRVFDGVYREVMEAEPAYEYSYGITDANVFAGEAGIPCLHLGPERGGAHQKNEYVPLASLYPVSRMYALIAHRFLSND